MDFSSIRVAAVVVTYNRKELLAECIDSLLSQSVSALLEVVIVDNASTDGTPDVVQSFASSGKVAYVNTGSNLGGAGGFNRAMREAVERGFDFAWVMDDDCIPNINALEELLIYAEALDWSFGWLSSKVLWKDGSICAMNLQRRDLARSVNLQSGVIIPAQLASFVSLFVPCSIILQYGLPISEFYLWTDDWEYTRRVSRSQSCYVIPSSVVVHKSAQNIGANIANESGERLERFKRMFRNDVFFYRKEGAKGLIYELLRLAVHSSRVLLQSTDHQKERLEAIWGGTLQGIRFNPEIEYVSACKDGVVRILEAFAEPISFGGEESYVVNTIANMNRDGLQIDLMSPYYCDNELYRNIVESWGGRVFTFGYDFHPGGLRIETSRALDRLLARESYDIVHIHTGSITAAANLAGSAKRHKASVIVHAHRGSTDSDIRHRVALIASRVPMYKYVDRFLACSALAAQTLYSARIAADQTKIVNNGIDLCRFSYSPELRQAVRQKLCLTDDMHVIGHVGRFSDEKNHSFLLRSFYEYHKNQPNSKLLLVGDGELQKTVKLLSETLGIEKDVLFLGKTDRPDCYYMAMDVFAFPSKFEGLGIVAIEAQATGLPVIASTNIPIEVDATGTTVFLPIEKTSDWASAMGMTNSSRGEAEELVREAGFDVRETSQQLRELYLDLVSCSCRNR